MYLILLLITTIFTLGWFVCYFNNAGEYIETFFGKIDKSSTVDVVYYSFISTSIAIVLGSVWPISIPVFLCTMILYTILKKKST